MELTEAIQCPGCGKLVDEAFYTQHINGDGNAARHTLHIINVPGVGSTTVVGNQQKKEPRMLDIPYLGRVTAFGFVVLCLFWLFLGVLLGARII